MAARPPPAFLKNTNFTGRQADLLELWRLLKPGGAAGEAVAIAVAAGMGGIGKTELAVEFCHRYGRCYAGVHWLAADQNIEAEIAACGLAMGLQPAGKAGRAGARYPLAGRAAGGGWWCWTTSPMRWSSRPGRRGWATPAFCSPSRQVEWAEGLGVSVQRLDVLERGESLALLRKLAPGLKKEDRRSPGGVAERLGDLPLALDLAGRFFKDYPGLTRASTWRSWPRGRGRWAHLAGGLGAKQPTHHATSLAATFLLSWEKLAGEGELETLARRLFLGAATAPPTRPSRRPYWKRARRPRTNLPDAGWGRRSGGCTGWGCSSRARAGRRSTRCWPSRRPAG